MINLQNFIREWSGKLVTDPWGGYQGQCVSLAKRWCSENRWAIPRGNAIDWQKYHNWNGFIFVPNRITTIPKPGDLAIFYTPVVYWQGHPIEYGHIGIVVSANIFKMQVFNQNYPHGRCIDPAQLTTFDYRRPKCVGFLRHQ